MYYLIKGILHDSEDPEIIEGTFEWAVENKEEALANIRDYEEVTEVVEITLEECIAHEEKITRSYVQKDYLLRRCMDLDEEEYLAKQKELNEPSKLYLTALREYNVRELLLKRLMRQKNFRKMTMGEYLDILNELVDAKDYDEVNEIIRRIKKK